MKAVWDHSRTSGNARMVLTLIANACDDEGWGGWPHQKTIAGQANLSERAVQRAIATAIELKELEVHRPTRDKSNRYTILLPGVPVVEDPAERARRDEEYERLALGQEAQSKRRREQRRIANARSEDTTLASPPASDPGHDAGVASGPYGDTTLASPPDTTLASPPDTTLASPPIEDPPITHQLPTEESSATDTTSAIIERLGEILRTEVNRHGGQAARGPGSKAWREPLAELLAKRPASEVEAIIRWSTAEKFWQPTIINPAALAKHFDTLVRQRRRAAAGQTASALVAAPAENCRPLAPDTEERLVANLRDVVDEGAWDLWLARCWFAVSTDDGHLVVGAEADRITGWISTRFTGVLTTAATEVLGVDRVEIVVALPPTASEERAA